MEPPMLETRSFNQVRLTTFANRDSAKSTRDISQTDENCTPEKYEAESIFEAQSGANEKTVRDVVNEEPSVTIPAALDMGQPTFEHTPNGQAAHHSCLLNDNCDGTFTQVGEYTSNLQNGSKRPALVKSKTPLPADASPMVEPQPPTKLATVRQQEQLAASQEKALSSSVPDENEENTVDEMMLNPIYKTRLISTEASESSALSALSRTPSLQNFQQPLSEATAFSGKSFVQSKREIPVEETKSRVLRIGRSSPKDAPRTPHDATQENWRLVSKVFTGRQFYQPKRGHFAALLASLRKRNISLRSRAAFDATMPRSVRLLIAHITGEQLPVPCKSCASGRGPFKRCVAISKKASSEITNGIVCCTNCASKNNLQRKCSVEEMLAQPRIAGSEVAAPGVNQIITPKVHSMRPSQPTTARGIDSEHKERLAPASNEQGGLSINSRTFKVDSRLTFEVRVIPVDGSLLLDNGPSSRKLCSLATGKVMVELEGNAPFVIGPHGMFQLMPGRSGRVTNASQVDAVLHVSILEK
ncbi:hypothetical protein Daus18300_001776 [Diaporthe australafricana]|uniref:Uncharacterized protein n=1 Tax=Diaporthe australafricana TaxID=127596 RepID=A0ABR3XT62_9PEZI